MTSACRRERPRAASRAATESPSASRPASGRGAPARTNHGPVCHARRPRSRPSVRVAAEARSRRRWRGRCRRRARGARARRVLEPGLERIDVHRQPALAPEVVPRVLVCGEGAGRVDPELLGQRGGERGARPSGVSLPGPAPREEIRIVPDGQRRPSGSSRRAPSAAAARPGTTCPCPSWSRPRGAKRLVEAPEQLGRVAALRRPEGVDVPLRGFGVVVGDERRLAAHRQPHVARRERARRPRAPSATIALPRLVGVRRGDARRLRGRAARTSRRRTSP